MEKKYYLVAQFCLLSLFLAGWRPILSSSKNVQDYLEGFYASINPSRIGSDFSLFTTEWEKPHGHFHLIENRSVHVDYPGSIRIGDSDQLRMTLEYSLSSQADVIGFQNFDLIFSNYDAQIEARLDLPGIKVDPPGPVRMALVKEQRLPFRWELTSENPGSYRGNLWIFLNLYQKKGDHELQVPIFILPVEIRAFGILGMDVKTARFAGWIGVVTSFCLLVMFLIHPDD